MQSRAIRQDELLKIWPRTSQVTSKPGSTGLSMKLMMMKSDIDCLATQLSMKSTGPQSGAQSWRKPAMYTPSTFVRG